MPPFTVVCNCRLSQAHIKLLRIHPNNLQLQACRCRASGTGRIEHDVDKPANI